MHGPAGSRRVGGRDVPTTRRVWPRGTVRFKRGTRVYTPDVSLPTRDASVEMSGR